MRRPGCKRPRRLAQHVRRLPFLQLQASLACFVAVVVAADGGAIGAAARLTSWRPGDLLLFSGLVVCSLVTVEVSRRPGETALQTKDVFAIWTLPIAVLLPPVFALLAPIPRLAFTQWRVRKIAPYRRVFTAAALGLSYGSASLVFHQLQALTPMSLTSPGRPAAAWLLGVAACCIVQWIVNNGLVLPAIMASDRSARLRDLILKRENLSNDLIECCVAAIVTLALAVTPVALLFALPFVTLLQRSSRHSQLVNESRIDGKTGLLNAVTWRREASAEVTRAARTGSPAAVALVDIDHFKDVNDAFGHLAGDEALRALSRVLREAVREYDLVGRFGGEEFSLLLPQIDEAGARAIAERIRSHVEMLRVDAGAGDGQPISVTVSVGVAAMAGGATGEGITDLLAAADAALYRAKGAGRNQVWAATETTRAAAVSQVS